MLSIKPSQRPTIVDILNKSFIRKRVAAYINECINCPQDLSPTDVDDIFADGLREQAEKLMIPGYYKETGSSLRMGPGRKKQSGQPKQNNNHGSRELRSQLEFKSEILRLKREIEEKSQIQSKLNEMQR